MPKYDLVLHEKKEVAENTLCYTFEKPDGFEFVPGQHMVMSLDVPLSPTETGVRSMTIASAPHETYLGFVMRHSNSAFKQKLFQMVSGETMTMFGPTGIYTLPQDPLQSLLMIAGGVGITPFYSMLVSLAHHKKMRNIVLVYSNSTLKGTIYKSKLDELTKQNKNLKVIYTLTQEQVGNKNIHHGRISAEILQKHVPDYLNRLVYICGSTPMVTSMNKLVRELGVLPKNTFIEDFTMMG